jgi:hypothetical protein
MAPSTTVHRHLCSQIVSITELNKVHPRPHAANLEEIGRSSVLVLTSGRIKRGTKVMIQCGNRALRGIARSCRPDPMLGFFVSIRLDWDSRWSPESFVPEHMLFMFGPA